MKSNLEIGGNSGIIYPWDRQLMVLIILKSDFQELKGLYIYEPSGCRRALRAEKVHIDLELGSNP